MKLLTYGFVLSAVSLACFAVPARGAVAFDGDEQGCSANHGWWHDSANFAQSRQERIPNASVNYIDPGQNGSIRVHAWNNPDVLVKACIQTSAPSESEARDLASQVKITKGAGHIEASAPGESGNGRNWSVSYEVWVPSSSAAKLDAYNGSIAVDGVQGRLRFHTQNGSVRLNDVGGDVEGETTNGSVTVRVTDANRPARGLRVETTNGSVNLELPQNFSARVEASTVNGRIRTDFPITVSGEIGKQLSFTLGNGGPEIAAKTVNGSIHISRRA